MTKKAKPVHSLAALAPDDFAAEVEAGGERRLQALAWLGRLIARAEEGDNDALKLALGVHEVVPRLWPATNVLRSNAERSVLDAMLGATKQLFTRAAIEHQVDEMRTTLLGETPSPLEGLLVDRIVVCWLECQYADITLAQRLKETCTFAQGEYHQRRAERTEKRLLRATTALATVRRLGVPTVQLNVAEEIKQVNVSR